MGFRLVFLSPHFSVSLFPEGTLRPPVFLLPHSHPFGFVLAAQSLRRSGSVLGFKLRISAFGLRASDFKVFGLRVSGLEWPGPTLEQPWPPGVSCMKALTSTLPSTGG